MFALTGKSSKTTATETGTDAFYKQIDAAVAHHNPENVEKLLEQLCQQEIKTTADEKREEKAIEIKQKLWLNFLNIITKQEPNPVFLETDKKIFRIYTTKIGYPDLSVKKEWDEDYLLCKIICSSSNVPFVIYVLTDFFSQPLSGGPPTNPVFLAYLKMATGLRNEKLVEQLYRLPALLEQDISEDAQREIASALLPIMHRHQYFAQLEAKETEKHETIFRFFIFQWDTTALEYVLVKQYRAQEKLRGYLYELVNKFVKEKYFPLLETSIGIGAHRFGNLPVVLLSIICDYLLYLTPQDPPPDATNNQQKSTGRLSAPPRRLLTVASGSDSSNDGSSSNDNSSVAEDSPAEDNPSPNDDSPPATPRSSSAPVSRPQHFI